MKYKRLFLIWLILGSTYTTIEVLWRGYTHPAMLVVGGLCGVLVGAINQIPKFYKLKIIWQSVIGAVLVMLVELAAGLILNTWLCLGIWDYSNLPLNLMGQICPWFGLLWLLIMPLAIWLEDTLRWVTYWYHTATCKHCTEQPPAIKIYTLSSVYTEFFTGK